MKSVLLKLDDSDLKVLDDISEQKKCSRSDLLRTIIKGFIDSSEVVLESEHTKSLESANKNLMFMMQALEKNMQASQEIIRTKEDQCIQLLASKKESADLYEKLLFEMKDKAFSLEDKISSLKNEIESKENSIAGLRSYVSKIKSSFWNRLFLPA